MRHLKRLMYVLIALVLLATGITGVPGRASANALVPLKTFGHTVCDVAVDSSGNLYVVENYYGATITRMDANGNNVVSIGPGFVYPRAVAVGADGYIYVTDTDPGNAGQGRVTKMDSAGGVIWQNIVGWPAMDVAADSSGNVYVVNGDYYSLVKYNSSFAWVKTYGGVSVGSPIVAGVAMKGTDVYFMDTAGQHYIWKIDSSDTVTAVKSGLGSGIYGSSTDRIAVDNSGNVYFVDNYDPTGIYKYDAASGNCSKIVIAAHAAVGIGINNNTGAIYVACYDSSTSNGEIDRFVPTPVVTSITPTSGPAAGGTSVTITGTGFTGATAVKFGSTAASSFTVNSDTQITAISPQESPPVQALVDVTVTTAGGTSVTGLGDRYTYLGSADSTKSTVSALPSNNVPADGTTSTVTVTLKDANNTALSGKLVTLASGSLTSSVTPSAGTTSNGSGVATFTVTDTKAESVSYTATDQTDGVTVSQKPSVQFIAGPVSSGLSAVSAIPPSVTANGTAISTITVTLKDANGNLVSGKTVTLTAGSGSSVITTVNGTSAADGTATFTVTDIKAETVIYQATGGGVTVSQTATVSFTPGPVESLYVSAAGTQTAGTAFDVTIAAKDHNGNTVTGYTGTVQLTSTDTAAVLPANYTYAVTDNGTHTFSVKLKTAGPQSITATDTGNGAIAGTTGSITVNPGTVDSGQSAVVADVSSVTANGTNPSTITVTVRDAYDNPVSNAAVTLTAGIGSSSVITTVNGTSAADGTATFTVTDIKAETVIYTAKAGGVTVSQTATVSFTPGPVESLNVSAAGTQTAGTDFDVTIAAKDHNGNTVTGYTGTVQLTSTDTAAALPANYTYAGTDNGTHTFSVKLKTAGTQSIAATDTGTGAIAGTTGNITVIPAVTDSGQSTVAASVYSVTADGVDDSAITVTLLDVYDNPVSNTAVTLAAGSGSSVITAVYGTSRSDGTAVFTVTDTKAETVIYTAKAGGVTVGQTATVSFIPGPAARLSWQTQPGGGTSGQAWPQQPVVILEDKNGNLETPDSTDGVGVALTTANGATLTGTRTVTLASGVAAFSGLSVDRAGAYALTATSGTITSSPSNSFTITAGSAGSTMLSVSPASVPADGHSAGTVSAVVYDANDNPVPNVALNFSTDLGELGSSVVTTDGSGQADDTITSTTAGAASVQVSGGGQSSPVQAVFTPTMAVTGLNPSYGPVAGGTLVTIEGNGLSVVNSVYFGTVAGTVYGTPNSVELSVYAPAGPSSGGSVHIVVNGPGGPSAETSADLFDYFTQVPAPTIDPAGGTFTGSASVSIGSVPTGDEAFYNLSQAVPNQASVPYTAPFMVDQSTWVTAAVYDPAHGEWGPAVACNFTIQLPASGGSDSGSSGSSHPVILQPAESTTGSSTISPAAGGTVGLGSDVSVMIPANALQGSSDAQVAVQKTDSPPPAPSGFMIMGAVYQFTVNDQNHYSFNKPVTLTFTFDPSSLAPGETPAVYYYDVDKGQWVDVGGTVSGNSITVTVDHFTKFAVMAARQAQEEKPAARLSDISGHWAEKNIEKLISLGAFSGYPDGTFKPDNTITRAEFAALLVKAFRLEAKSGRVFGDTASHWARDAVSTAAAYGIVGGYNENTFGPDDPVTREQMAVMTVKAAKLTPTSGGLAFTDGENISPWANDAVGTAVRDGIIKGYPDNTFRPGGNATRAEAVTVIVSALDK